MCPKCVPALVEGGNNASSTLQLHLLKNVIIYPPPNPHISGTAFSHSLQKKYTPCWGTTNDPERYCNHVWEMAVLG